MQWRGLLQASARIYLRRSHDLNAFNRLANLAVTALSSIEGPAGYSPSPPHLHYDTKRPQRRREQWRQRNVQKSVTHVQIVTFLKFLLPSPSSLLKLPNNKPLPSSKNPHFQNEAKFTAFLVKMSFICMRMKNHFHIKGCALNLVLIPRPEVTRTWPIHRPIGQNNNRADC